MSKNQNRLQELDVGLRSGPYLLVYLADPGPALGCSTNTVVRDSLIHLVSHVLPPLTLRRPQVQVVNDGAISAFSHKKRLCGTGLGHLKFLRILK